MWRLNVEKTMTVLATGHTPRRPAGQREEGHTALQLAAPPEKRRPLAWTETNSGTRQDIPANPALWGDVVLWRWDAPSSYHLSVVLDDATQGVTDVVRGMDLFHATHIHRLLQELLGLPAPTYYHHPLIRNEAGQKLSKSIASTGLRALGEVVRQCRKEGIQVLLCNLDPRVRETVAASHLSQLFAPSDLSLNFDEALMALGATGEHRSPSKSD